MKKSKIGTWLKEPIITKKVDPYLNFLLAFLGAMIGTAFYRSTDMSYWEYILWLIPFAFLIVLIIKVISSVWKNSRKQRDER
ncbi:hypothetical protein [Planococcus beijingensis]|uniref:hypothetical protein n=1 Tax=Planococcus beijingensis TaxID=2782551 RepID=UPI00193C10D5|nr:hypothetical protein [Planococcus beijingensis]